MTTDMFSGNLHVVTVAPDAGNQYLEAQRSSSQKPSPIQSAGRIGNGNHGQPSLGSQSASLPLGSHNIAIPGNKDERLLPTREVTDQTIDDAYVNFIMYCNPSIPLNTDTMELRKVFRAPPKSDGKSFSTFTLFELIGRLEADDDKEIKTWAALVENMGVEKPSVEKNQSTQKVQQYAVRLKRWMHAMHIDAFFEFLLNKKPHVYWTQVPAANDSASVQERDGVPAEEDLALRALLPETRPKRGRRRAEDREDMELGKSPSQRPRIESPTLTEGFVSSRLSLASEKNGTPATAHPDVRQRYGDRMVPWSATEVRTAVPEIFHWPPEESQTPNSAYPQSAVTPTVNRAWNDLDEPQSAITSKSRSRRRHGPAVSSAWLSNGSLSSGKVRGRPPSNRSVQDGPFSTFPANPSLRDSLVNRLSDNTPTASPIVSQPNVPLFFPPQPQPQPQSQSQPQPQPQPQPQLQSQPPPPQPSSRPSRLQLQVPERQGGEVRLATPPPVVLVNGQSNSHIVEGHDFLPNQYSMPLMQYFNSPNSHDPSLPHFVSITFQQNEPADGTNVDSLESHITCEILAAEWLDIKGCAIDRCTIDEADKICKQVVRNLRAESTSDQTFLINLAALAGGPLMTKLRVIRLEEGSVSHYECHWKLRFGAIEGDLKIRAAVQHNPEPNNRDDSEPEDSEQSWKERYLELRQEIRTRDEKVGRLKRGVLDALVFSNEFSGVK